MIEQLNELLPELLSNYETSRRTHYKRLLLERPQSHEVTHAQLYVLFKDKRDDFNFLNSVKHADSSKMLKTDLVTWKGPTFTQDQIDKVVAREVADCKHQMIDRLVPRINKVIKTKKIATTKSSMVGKLSGHITFNFEDDSKFTLQLQLMWEYSNRGRIISKFPLSFIKVKKSDGTKMSKPSLTKMQKGFK